MTASASSLPSRLAAAAAGATAAAVAVAVGELVTGARGSGPSLVTAIGTEFVDRFAARLKSFAVEVFGTNDKPALITGIVVVAIALGALFGILAARRAFWLGALGFAAFGAVGLWAYQLHPLGSTATGVTAAIAAVVAGVGSLWALLRLARPVDAAVPPEPASTPLEAPGVDGVARTGRRTFLVGVASLSALAIAGSIVGTRMRTSTGSTERARAAVRIPRPGRSRPAPKTQPFEVPGLTPYVVPNADFYRIDTALSIPQVDVNGWKLDIGGLVDRPFSITYDELLAMDSVEEVVTLQCVSNEVGGRLVGNAVWQGVPLAALLERAGVQAGATQVVGRSVDDFTAGFPTDVALDGRVAMVAYAMNGEPLPARSGFPARLVVAGLYGYVSATKWLREIELTTWEEFDGFWITRGWSKDGPIKTMSRIDVPNASAPVTAGPTAVAGVAWAPTRGIEAVEVQVDDGPWERCELGDVASENTWVQWRYRWDASAGDHVVRCRATDGTGAVQTAEETPPQPDGATGLPTRRVSVRG